MIPALEISHVRKRFGDTIAVDDLSLRLEDGAFLGLLGRNGAGKTTTINMATGLIDPTSGRISVLGIDVARDPIAVKRRIGVMPQEESILDSLTGREYLRFVGSIHGLGKAEIDRRIDELFDVLDLEAPPGAQVREYSYGMKKKIGLGAALIHGPRVLFLDEPFEGIDPLTARTIRTLLLGLREKGTTIVMSSHVLDIVEKICNPVAIIDRGKLVGFGTVEELRGDHGDASLDDLFVSLMGGAREGDLSWL